MASITSTQNMFYMPIFCTGSIYDNLPQPVSSLLPFAADLYSSKAVNTPPANIADLLAAGTKELYFNNDATFDSLPQKEKLGVVAWLLFKNCHKIENENDKILILLSYLFRKNYGKENPLYPNLWQDMLELYNKLPQEIKSVLPAPYCEMDAKKAFVKADPGDVSLGSKITLEAEKKHISSPLPKTLGQDDYCFYDPGCDPDFSEDGLNYNPPRRTIVQIVLNAITIALFHLRCYLSPNAHTRKTYQLIFSAAKANESWRKIVSHRKFGQNNDKIKSSEKTFFQSTAALHGGTKNFDSELLRPIHVLNGGQGRRVIQPWDPFWTDCDLPRSGDHPLSYLAMPHYLFAYRISKPATELRVQVRNLRNELRNITRDFRCALSVKACEERIQAALGNFAPAWADYEQQYNALLKFCHQTI